MPAASTLKKIRCRGRRLARSCRDRLRVADRAQCVRDARDRPCRCSRRGRRRCGCCTSATSTCGPTSGASRRGCASWPACEPDLVVNTGDNLAHPKAVPAVVQTLGDLLSVPGVFVFGSNDYFGPRLKNPANYLTNPAHRALRRAAAVAGPAGRVHRARLARHDAHPPRARGGRACGSPQRASTTRTSSATATTPSRAPPSPAAEPEAGR